MTKSSPQQTIIVFDIRNFSEHRSRLADIRRATLLTVFVEKILNKAVELIEIKQNEFGNSQKPTLNHTGDGFVLILRGNKNPLISLFWISEFRRFVFLEIKKYQNEIHGLFPSNPPKKLDFGIGAHYGLARRFTFKDFRGNGEREGFIGSAINIASRVEQCTKDHPFRVLCTEQLQKQALKLIPVRFHKKANANWESLGKHRLRGFEKSYVLLWFKPGFHDKFTARQLSALI